MVLMVNIHKHQVFNSLLKSAFVIFVLMFCPQLQAVDAAIHASGILEQFNGTNLTTTYHFTISVDNCRWLIHATTDGSPAAFYEDSYDGQYTYYYIKFRSKPHGVNNSSTALMETNDIPYVNSEFSTVVWLAYGSSCYFSSIKGNMVKPFLDWGEPDVAAEGIPIKVEWKRSGKPPFLPTSVFSEDLNRRYKVLDFTNYGGLYLPSKFVMEAFLPYSKATGVPTFSLHGTLTSVSQQTSVGDFKPRMDGKTLIEDRRFAHIKQPAPQLFYFDTNAHWLSITSAQLATLYQRSIVDNPNPPSPDNFALRRNITLVLLLCPTFAFVIYAILRWRRSGKKCQ